MLRHVKEQYQNSVVLGVVLGLCNKPLVEVCLKQWVLWKTGNIESIAKRPETYMSDRENFSCVQDGPDLLNAGSSPVKKLFKTG